MKLLLVGGGLTSSVTASLLKEYVKVGAKLECWDKARGVGGRMSTSRAPDEMKCTADLGAQYFSLMPQYANKHKSFHDELINANVLRPITAEIEGESSHPVVVERAGEEGMRNFSAVDGSSSIVKYFFRKAGLDVKCNMTVNRIDRSGEGWRVSAISGESDVFDGLVLTMPTPQILSLEGDIRSAIGDEVRSKLERVSYSSRYALALYYKTGLDVAWTAKYIYDNPCVRFMAVDTKKRGIESGPVSVVVHTSVPFGLQHLEGDREEVGRLVMDHVRQVAPELPTPDHVKTQKWRYSQVHRPYEGTPGCVLVQESPALILAGDAFIHSNLDGCIASSIITAQTLQTLIR